MGYRQAHRDARRLGADRPAGRGTVLMEIIPLAPGRVRRAIGLAVDHVGDVADQGRIENFVDRLAVIMAALVPPPHAIGFGDHEGRLVRLGLGHKPTLHYGAWWHRTPELDPSTGPILANASVQFPDVGAIAAARARNG